MSVDRNSITQEPLAPVTPLRYRPDIDGMRAIAVLSVVAFHARLRWVPGGFVGVDIFFVISGYLISAIIMRDIFQGRFSVIAFYERRIRRIFPAMLAMFTVVSIVACWLLLPGELIAYGWSLLAALFSGSNFLFWHDVGYFDMASSFKPLLHTWSLAVEEQFYLLFPPFLLLLRGRSRQHIRIAVITLTILSFVASAIVVSRDSAEAFYFTPLRIWELLLGTILSQHYLPKLHRPWLRNTASLAGLALILFAILFYRETTLFPGLSALPPCIGAGLIIAAGETGPSVVGRILSWRPVVFIGLISYSLYLWHWPVMVFQNTDSLLIPARFAGHHLIAPVIILLSLLLGTLSWAFVERPFRTGALRLPRRKLFASSAVAVVVLSVAAVSLILLRGLPGRYPADARTVAAYLDYAQNDTPEAHPCFITPVSTFQDFHPQDCLAQHAGRKSILLLGDSHANTIYASLKAAFPDQDVLQANVSACRALLNEPSGKSRTCYAMSNLIFRDFLVHHHVDTLLFAGAWFREDLAPLAETLSWAQQRNLKPVVIGNNVGFNSPLPRILATELRKGQPDNAAGAFAGTARQIDQEMAEQAHNYWHVPYVSFFSSFCAPQCPVYAAHLVPITFDAGHLTREGADLYVSAIRRSILQTQ